MNYRYVRTKRPERLEALLIVAARVSFILWLLHLAASERQQIRRFQANTEGRLPILSTVFLGQDLWRNHRLTVTFADQLHATIRLKLLVMHEARCL